MSAIRPAATVVLLRENRGNVETLLLQRQAAVQFASGMWVFPGGRIDETDFDGANNDIVSAAKKAAIRETREETGLDIADCTLELFAHWTTPEGEVKRYATWFLIAAIGAHGDVIVDGGEIGAYRWLTPAAAIATHRAGDLKIMPPTFTVLHEMNSCANIAAIFAMYRARPLLEIHPRRIKTEAGLITLYNGDSGYDSGDTALPGTRHRMLHLTDGLHYVRDVE
ncbi:MAG: hypothetical protein JWM78_3453 [Verrucomicrobiaceae bacterium]|nr:hypothetical protein [Verrucomicrobiaceae bacterium]